MRITDVKTYPVRAPIGGAQGTGREAWSEVTALFVRIETDSGLVGWGEGFARFIPKIYAEIVEQLLKPILIGADPFAVEALWQKMYRTLFGRSGGMLIQAIAAVDIALWDIIGRALGEPLYRSSAMPATRACRPTPPRSAGATTRAPSSKFASRSTGASARSKSGSAVRSMPRSGGHDWCATSLGRTCA